MGQDGGSAVNKVHRRMDEGDDGRELTGPWCVRHIDMLNSTAQ